MNKRVYKLYDRTDFEENCDEIVALHNELRDEGYVYVECTEEMNEVVQNLFRISKTFFDLSVDEKMNFAIKSGKKNSKNNRQKTNNNSSFLLSIYDFFTSNFNQPNTPTQASSSTTKHQTDFEFRDPNPREYYDILANSNRFQNKDFEIHSKKGFQMFESYSRRYLEQILFPLKCDFSCVQSMFGPPSKTTLRLLKYYYNGHDDKETCLRHTDRGLLYFVCCVLRMLGVLCVFCARVLLLVIIWLCLLV